MRNSIFTLLVCTLSLQGIPASATDFSGPVVSVRDGELFEALHLQHPERIRLNGIDCPEGMKNGDRLL